jgi:hypothetical protein
LKPRRRVAAVERAMRKEARPGAGLLDRLLRLTQPR